MHTLDLLMKQGLIIVSIFVVLGLFVAVLVLIALPRLRKMQQRNAIEAQRRAAEQAILDRADLITAEEAAPVEVDASVRATPIPQRKGSAVPETANTAPTAIATAKPAPKLLTATPIVNTPKPETPPASEEEKPSSDMQDLLNSVFSDDEAQERYQLLMQGREPITAAELLDLAEHVSEKLRQRLPNAG